MPGQNYNWQHLDAQGLPTPYYLPPGTPHATPNLSNNMVFPPQGHLMTPEERLASMYPTMFKASSESQADGDSEGGDCREQLLRAAEVSEPVEKEVRKENVETFTEEPPVGLSSTQQGHWRRAYLALVANEMPGEQDPQHKRARGKLLKLQRLAALASKVNRWE